MNPSAGAMGLRRSSFSAERHDDAGLFARLRAKPVDPKVGWSVLSTPVRAVAPERLVETFPGEAHIFWSSPGEEAYVGLGVAREIRASGVDRMRVVKEEAAQYFSMASPEAKTARFFGGFAFAPGQASSSPWTTFGDACFVMPRWLYRVSGDTASLTLVWDDTAAEMEAHLAYQAFELERALAQRPSEVAPAGPAPIRSIEHLDYETWREQVDAIRGAIGAGRFHKIVAARRSTIRSDRGARVQELLGKLSEAHVQCTRYSLSWSGDETFVGATPERLVRLVAGEVFSDALAGSIPIAEAEGLLRSAKDAHEHRFVVDAIVEALHPYLSEIDYPSTPRLRRLRDVAHLEVPIRGTLAKDYHVLDLVRALHPTPAVGGMPLRGAQDWIVEHEKQPRGWYASPIGWFDASGDGDFAVALRCGLLAENEAHIFAGAGIVEGSEPRAEYVETRLKMQVLIGALGAEEER